jgi:hypothetical protein
VLPSFDKFIQTKVPRRKCGKRGGDGSRPHSGMPGGSGSSRRPPEVGRWDRLKRAMTRVDSIRQGRSRDGYVGSATVRIIGVCTEFQRPNVTHFGSRTVSAVQASGNVVTRQRKRLCVVPPGRSFYERSRFSAAWVASNSDGVCVSIRTPYLGWSLKASGAT